MGCNFPENFSSRKKKTILLKMLRVNRKFYVSKEGKILWELVDFIRLTDETVTWGQEKERERKRNRQRVYYTSPTLNVLVGYLHKQ